MSAEPQLTKAKITSVPQGGGKATSFDVHFNPVSLQYSVSSTMKDEGNGKTSKQHVSKVTGKLTMDLVFDNTRDGNSVQITTQKLAAFMGSAKKGDSKQEQTPPIIVFEWGSYKFQGMMESYKETIDFFSPNGVPLRSTVNMTLVEQDIQFSSQATSTAGNLSPDTVSVPAGTSQNSQTMANQAGDPGAARALAALNGQDSVRFSAGASLTVSGSVPLGPPVAFATGGAGIGIGGGAGIGISGGVGIGVSGGAGIGVSGGAEIGVGGVAGIGVSASAGGNIFGGSAAAGVSATEGAFAGLRTPPSAPAFALNTGNFLPSSDSLTLSTNNASGFQVGGRATLEGPGGLSTDVGATADLRARIQFEG